MGSKLNVEPQGLARIAKGSILLSAAVLATPAIGRTQAAAPTTCPTNYTCSYQNASTVPLIGSPSDGQPGAAVGYITFDADGNFSGLFSGNSNGKPATDTVLTGTCVSGTSTTLGRINFNAGLSGKPGSLAFVTAPNGSHTDLIFAGSALASDTRVIVGTCRGN